MITPAEWEAAGATLEATEPRNALEQSAKDQLRARLAAAVKAYLIGTGLHAQYSEPQIESYAFLLSPITTVELAAVMVEKFMPAMRGHVSATEAHLKKPPKANDGPIAVASARANWLQGAMNGHVSAPDLHFNDASPDAILAPSATGDDASLIALADELRVKVPRHLRSGASMRINVRRAQDQPSVSYSPGDAREWLLRVRAEGAAMSAAATATRGGARALGYAPGFNWEGADYQTLSARFTELEQLPGFADNEYCTAVVRPAARALTGARLDGARPPTQPPAPRDLVEVSGWGELSPVAEANLQTMIDNIGEFASGMGA